MGETARVKQKKMAIFNLQEDLLQATFKMSEEPCVEQDTYMSMMKDLWQEKGLIALCM